MQQVSEKCKLFLEKKNMTKVPEVQTQAVSEHVFYIGSIFVKFPSAIEPEEEAISRRLEHHHAVGFSLERIPLQVLV